MERIRIKAKGNKDIDKNALQDHNFKKEKQ